MKNTERLSLSKKNANNKQWYKDKIDSLDSEFNRLKYTSVNSSGVSEYQRIKVNYDLFNNSLNIKDFEYVIKPWGEKVGELPATFTNKDIVSGKIKAVVGMEMDRPFSFSVVAVNPEATTRREQEEAKRIREWAINYVMQPIREQEEIEYQKQIKGKDLTEEEKQKIKEEIHQMSQSQTPDEVRKYMQRKHQDPAEVMTHQLLQYFWQSLNLKNKFDKALLHGLLSAKEVMYSGIVNDNPVVWNINSLRVIHDESPDLDFIEDGEYAAVEYKLSPSEIIKYLGTYLKDKEIDDIYDEWQGYSSGLDENDLFTLTDNDLLNVDSKTISVVHAVWKSLRRIGFLSYKDDDGELQEMLVDENYKLNKDNGDISISWEWIPEVYEGWKIKTSKPIYVKMQPIPGQFKDIDNIYYCKLPYKGVLFDNLSENRVSLMDRLKYFQYYYNIIMFRIEMLMASDKAKKVLLNINSVPDSKDFPLEKWQYYFETTPFMYWNPDEEGSGYQDVNTVAKVIDLSLTSNIKQYIDLAEYIRQQAGRSVGISEQFEGQIQNREAVRNTQQAIRQTSNILELYYNLHDKLKQNVLQSLIENAKIAYSGKDSIKLTYILDDMSRYVLNVDMGLLDMSTLGLFISNTSNVMKIKEMLKELTHAAIQNQKIELSDVFNIIRQDNLVEAEETLKASEDKLREQQSIEAEKERQFKAQEAEKERKDKELEHERQKELIVLKEEERRKTDLAKTALMGASFNPNIDKNKNGKNDFIELEEFILKQKIENEKIKQRDRELDLKEKELKQKEKENKNKK